MAAGKGVAVSCERGTSVIDASPIRRASRPVFFSSRARASPGAIRPRTGAALLFLIRSLVTKMDIPVCSLNRSRARGKGCAAKSKSNCPGCAAWAGAISTSSKTAIAGRRGKAFTGRRARAMFATKKKAWS